MKKVIGFEGSLTFDTTKSDGPPRKLINVSRLSNMGWNHNTSIKEGLIETYEWYLESCK
jgi:GDP-L-fucose synthase